MSCYFRNFFPDNLAQACFAHVKTTYTNVTVRKKRIEFITISDTVENTTFLPSNSTTISLINITPSPEGKKTIVEYTEQVVRKGLQSGNGINVLGLYTTTMSVGSLLFLWMY